MYKKAHKVKASLVFLFLIISLAILCGRLFFIQIIKYDPYSRMAADQHKLTIPIEARRGTIYDRNMKEVASSIPAYSVYAVARDLKQKATTARLLAPILGLDEKFLLDRLMRNKPFVWLSRKVHPEVADQIKELGIDEIKLMACSRRSYPGGELMSHVVGFCDVDNNGLEGLELYYDDYLKGAGGWCETSRDGRGFELAAFEANAVVARDGYDLVLELDELIQHMAQDALSKAVKRWKANYGIVIVMDPRDGAILAMANYPTFDPNHPSSHFASQRRNRTITDCFEPGSSFKIVTAAAALEEGLVEVSDKFYCEEGAYRVGGRTLHDYRPNGWLTFSEVIVKSSNIGTVKVAQNLGKEKLWSFAGSFGFGRVSRVDLPGEVRGILRQPSEWSKTSISAIPMGQEVACTALQLVGAISCIANDGRLMKPRIVSRIVDKNGELVRSFPPEVVRRVVTKETARKMKDILIKVVEEGTGKEAGIAGYKVAGKTGTAQKAKPDGSGYSDTRFVASFIGFAPAEDPLFSMVVVIDEPTPRHFGGTVCAPVFREVAQGILKYLEVKD